MKNSMYSTLVFWLVITTWAQAQDAGQIVQQYRVAIAQIETLHCQVEQLDTFVTGNVWHYQGELTMLRDPADELFGFQYRAAKEVGGVALYDGLSAFEIDHDKETYEVEPSPRDYILGSPGGQLVVQGLMYDQDPDRTPEVLEKAEYYVMRYSYPDLEEYDVRQREKRVFLDKTTFLPMKIVARQVSLGKKQVLTRIISEMRINRAEHEEAFQKDFLSNYKMVVEEPAGNPHADLLKTPVQDFALPTFAGKSVSTQPQPGKVLLLDFWEVWCGPCVESMPKVQQLAEEYGPQGLQVVGVLMDPNSQDSAERLIRKRDLSFTQALGSQKLRDYFRVYAIPQYVLIDQNGIIQDVFMGYKRTMEKQIKKLLAEAE